jgi:hypothetical protein
MLGRQPVHEFGALPLVGDVGLIGDEVKAPCGGLSPGDLKSSGIAGDDDDLGARLGETQGRGLADPGRASGDHDHTPGDLSPKRAVDVKLRVEMAFPIIPKPPGVILQARYGDPGGRQETLGLAAVETGRIIEKSEDVGGQAEILH